MSTQNAATGGSGGQQYLGLPPWEDRESMHHFYVECGYTLEQVRTEVCDGQVSEGRLREQLGEFGLLDPWDDPSWLAEKYGADGEDLTCEQIADDELEGAVTSETIRQRLHEFDLIDEFASYGVDGEAAERAREAFADVPEGVDGYQRLRGNSE